MLEFSIFEVKSLFISYMFNISGVITFNAFLWPLKNPIQWLALFSFRSNDT